MMTRESPSVLVVDDDVDISTNLCDILSDIGYRTDMAHDGPSALHRLEMDSYDLALLDFKMPGMDGATLLRKIRKLAPKLVTIVITAYAEDEGVQRAVDAGTWKVLSKPVDVPRLLQLVKQATDKQPD